MIKQKLPKIAYRLLYILAILAWILIVIVFISPKVLNDFIPYLIDLKSAQAEGNQGIDLEPMQNYSQTALQGSDSNSQSVFSENVDSNVSSHLDVDDPRIYAAQQFLKSYDSPMAPYAEIFIRQADKNKIDWRLLIAISGVESAFGTIIRYQSYNAWGWRGGANGNFNNFKSWPHAITQVSAGMGRGYQTNNPFEIEPYYCPPCGQTPGHPWANGVAGYMNALQKLVEKP